MTASEETIRAVHRVLGKHGIECTGRGEVTCRECRGVGWMSWDAYHYHLARQLADANLLRQEVLEERMDISPWGLPQKRRYVTEWEEVSDDEIGPEPIKGYSHDIRELGYEGDG